MTVILDDHLLRDWIVGPDDEPERVLGHEDLATTNLWYARLCKSAARAGAGALIGKLNVSERLSLAAALVQLPETLLLRRCVIWHGGWPS